MTKFWINILSGPTAVGKTTLAGIVCTLRPTIHRAVSYTTRAPKRGEVHGVDYHFVNRESFLRKLEARRFAEHAEVHGELYGTLKLDLAPALRKNGDVLLVIDVQGMLQIKQKYPEITRTIFLHLPSFVVLEERIRRRRGGESEEEIQRRLLRAEEELAIAPTYDHEVVNADIQSTARELLDKMGLMRVPTQV